MLPPKSFTILPASAGYGARIVVNGADKALQQRLDILSMWGGVDKRIYDCPSWEMDVEELAVAKKWCKQMFFMFFIEWKEGV